MSALDVSYFLSARADDLNLSATMIAQRAGISRQTWYRLINAEIQQARIETLVSIANVLQVSLMELSYLYTNKNRLNHQFQSKNDTASDSYSLIRDSSKPTNALVFCNETFAKEWEIINLGTEEWVDRKLVCINPETSIATTEIHAAHLPTLPIDYLQPLKNSIDIPAAAPGDVITLKAKLIAPENPGTSISLWKMVDKNNQFCFADDVDLLCQVRVFKDTCSHKPEIAKVA